MAGIKRNSHNNLLYGPSTLNERFDDFKHCLEELSALKWTTQTYFLFVRFPDKYMFMKPTVTKSAAQAFAFDLNYSSKINWLSYESLLTFSQYIFNELPKLNDSLTPRDMIDVQSFVWSSVKGNIKPK